MMIFSLKLTGSPSRKGSLKVEWMKQQVAEQLAALGDDPLE